MKRACVEWSLDQNMLRGLCSLSRVPALNTSRFPLLPRLQAFATMAECSFYDLCAKDIKGNDFHFSQLKDKVCLIVNVASQYKELQEMYMKHKDQGFVVIGFPCNQFGNEEPGTEAEIEKFACEKYGVTFPMMSKVEVNGDNTHPVYKFLKSEKKQMFMEVIKWNFEKFLVDRKGEVVQRFSSVAEPMKDIEPEVCKLLGAQPQATS